MTVPINGFFPVEPDTGSVGPGEDAKTDVVRLTGPPIRQTVDPPALLGPPLQMNSFPDKFNALGAPPDGTASGAQSAQGASVATSGDVQVAQQPGMSWGHVALLGLVLFVVSGAGKRK